MAERRMFAKSIIDSDSFLDLPASAQNLYFHLAMRADDDGFVNNPKRIQRMLGACDDDVKLLFVKQFLIPFDSGIVVIKHWRIHNYIQKDRYKPTACAEEKSRIVLCEDSTYRFANGTECIQTVHEMDAQVRLGKVRLEKESNTNVLPKKEIETVSKRFTPPTLDEVRAYCEERNNGIEPRQFINFYEAAGWMRGKTKIRDWKACVRTWEGNKPRSAKKDTFTFSQRNVQNEDVADRFFDLDSDL